MPRGARRQLEDGRVVAVEGALQERLIPAVDAPLPHVLAGAPRPFLAAFVQEYDPCPPGGIACGANDWCDLRQRMHYITHLFRAYAETAAMFSRPFTPQQVAAFRAGRVPDGDI